MSIVYKFGGSTIRSADALRSISDIIINSKDLSYVVVSATFNTTNELEEIAKVSLQSVCRAKDHLDTLNLKHTKIAKELNCLTFCKDEFNKLFKEAAIYISQINDEMKLSDKMMDSVYSLGERYSSVLLYSYIKNVLNFNISHVDARELITTNADFKNATPLFGLLENKVLEHARSQSSVPVITQGFIGRSLNGETTTLGREGSDYTASILAWAIKASKIVIWKDVGGIMTWDPKLKSSPKLLHNISYDEAQILTECGAKVLFHRTMNPLRERNIPLEVKGIQNPELEGTIISKNKNGSILGIVEEDIGSNKVLIWLCGNDFLTNQNILNKIIQFKSNQEIEIHNFSNQTIGLKVNKQIKASLVADLSELVFQES